MSIALVSIHSPEYRELSALTWDCNKKLYCIKHNYIGENVEIPAHPKMCFEKFKIINRLFLTHPDLKWAWATGCDSMITDFTNDLSTIINSTKASFLVTTDRNGINADSFLVKNDNLGHYILDCLLNREDVELDEQAAINTMLQAVTPGIVEILPQRVINSYQYNLYPNPNDRLDKLGTDGQWQYGDLFIHWPGFSDNPERRVVWAKEYLNKVKYE